MHYHGVLFSRVYTMVVIQLSMGFIDQNETREVVKTTALEKDPPNIGKYLPMFTSPAANNC